MKKTILLPDIHHPYQNRMAWISLLEFLKDFIPDEIVLLGDAMDMRCLNHHEEGNLRHFETKRLISDYRAFEKEIIQPINELCPKAKKVYLFGNHECLDDKTELLTKRGWINYKEIKLDDIVFSFNPETKLGEWVKIDKLIIQKFSGKLNRINLKTLDLLATDNHKIFYKTKLSNKYKYTEIRNLPKTRILFPMTNTINNPEYNISDNWIKLIAWILTDGHIAKPKSGYLNIGISQRKSKMPIVEKIVNDLGLEYSLNFRDRDIKKICGKIVKTQESQGALTFNSKSKNEILKYIDKSKNIPDWVDKLSDRQFTIFLQSLIDGDGSRHKSSPNSSWIMYGRKQFLEKLQILCITHNYSASLSVYRETQYRLNICVNRKFFNLENSKQIKKENYVGDVWDLTVKNHNFMIRRNGKCHFTGNSWVDQAIDKDPSKCEGIIEIENCIDLKGWQVIPYIQKKANGTYLRGKYQVGKLQVMHGDYTNQYHSAKTVNSVCKSIAYGHSHDIQSFSQVTANDINDTHIAWSIGCLCNLSPSYIKGRANKWVNGFAVVYSDEKTGNFNLYQVVISNNKFMFNGKTYKPV